MKNGKISGLYAITPELENTAELLEKSAQTLIGGAQLIQYRSKSTDKSLLKEQAISLLRLCRNYEIPLIINDHLDLAMEIDADGVHIGQDDLSVTYARKRLGQGKIIGASCYNNLNLALQAEKEGADYVAFGAFFPSLTKPDAVAVSLNLIDQARKQLLVPIVAIGGIRSVHVGSIVQSGCAAVAVCNDLFYAENITVSAAQYAQLFEYFINNQ
ncbi:MAG: thiamine phosphate synthase [Nitrosomonas sp.]|nr:MAG: thiamine phosphate synthase [Nitrosomonas sp.]